MIKPQTRIKYLAWAIAYGIFIMCHDIGGTVPPAARLKGFGETGTHKALTFARAGSTPAIPVLRKYQSGDWASLISLLP